MASKPGKTPETYTYIEDNERFENSKKQCYCPFCFNNYLQFEVREVPMGIRNEVLVKPPRLLQLRRASGVRRDT